MSEKHPECPLYNPLNCKEYYNPKLCAFVKKDKICLKKKKTKNKAKQFANRRRSEYFIKTIKQIKKYDKSGCELNEIKRKIITAENIYESLKLKTERDNVS
ncbi:MAG: hypothetical protein JRC55_07050 [Deltaproteobacteria bacterium]|nr:hypothetical protein [Deltaproteobacteria bacterium]